MYYLKAERKQKYYKAKKDLLEAGKSCSELSDDEKINLFKELMGEKAFVALYNQIRNMSQ
ncbi:MAG: hypothetical protein HFE57_01870 [Firmicutes bacterium]|jgi:hypothetical protein|nr:hypothetical protein [Bacillota bacterium]